MSENLQAPQLPTVNEYVADCNRRGLPTGYHDDDGDELVMTGFSVNRDSGTLDRVNFECCKDSLQRAFGSDVAQVIRFGHFACGWIDYLVVQRGHEEAAKAVAALKERLEDYPVLDDDALAEAEDEEARESWSLWAANDFRRALNAQFGDSERDEDPADELSDDQLWELYQLTDGDTRDICYRDIASAVAGLSYEPNESGDIMTHWVRKED